MEIKATLNAPWTREERFDFIIKQNHEKGYDIKEYEDRIEAWGLTSKEKQKKEEEKILNLSCSKRVLALILEKLGFSYKEVVKPKIEENERASLEWELCGAVKRDNPLVDILGDELGLTKQQIDNIFKYASGEIQSLEVEQCQK